MHEVMIPHVFAQSTIGQELKIQKIEQNLKFKIYTKIRNRVEAPIKFMLTDDLEDELFLRMKNGRNN